MSAGFALLKRFLRETSGFAIDDGKSYFVEERLRPLLRAEKIESFDELARCLHTDRHSELARTVAETLTINESSFFRDRALFTALSDQLLPRLFDARQAKRHLRIWCAGCSTGQEPLSVAMLVDEKLKQNPGWRVEILATDLSRPAIEQAQRGRYSQFEVQRGLPIGQLLRHFTRSGESWQASDQIRARISFKQHNLLAGAPQAERFDIIFCRNVLFYFDAETKRRVLRTLSGALAPDGFLALGGAERIGDLCASLKPANGTPFLFVRGGDGEP